LLDNFFLSLETRNSNRSVHNVLTVNVDNAKTQNVIFTLPMKYLMI